MTNIVWINEAFFFGPGFVKHTPYNKFPMHFEPTDSSKTSLRTSGAIYTNPSSFGFNLPLKDDRWSPLSFQGDSGARNDESCSVRKLVFRLRPAEVVQRL